jgi:hypothetical protein
VIIALYYKGAISGLHSVVDSKLDFVEGFRRLILSLIKEGKRVVVVYPIPKPEKPIPKYLIRMGEDGERELEKLSFGSLQESSEIRRMLDSITSKKFIPVKTEDVFCPNIDSLRCMVKMDDNILYSDGSHLSEFGADLLMQHIQKRLFKND